MRFWRRDKPENPQRVHPHDALIGGMTNMVLGQNIVKATREIDEKREVGLDVGPTQEWLSRLVREFNTRKEDGTWDLG